MEIMAHTTYVIEHERKGRRTVVVTRVTDEWIDGIIADTNDMNRPLDGRYLTGDVICMRRALIHSAVPIGDIDPRDATADDIAGIRWWNSLSDQHKKSLFSHQLESTPRPLTPKFFWEAHKLGNHGDES